MVTNRHIATFARRPVSEQHRLTVISSTVNHPPSMIDIGFHTNTVSVSRSSDVPRIQISVDNSKVVNG